MTKSKVLAMYDDLLAHAKVHTDSQGNGNEDPERHAFNGVRSNVHAELQAATPPPEPDPADNGDPEMHHMRQKAHFKMLWQRTDELVAQAGITEKGLAS